MKLSVIIPAFNEEKTIEKTVKDLFHVLNEHKIEHEIIVVNDHSTDLTKQIICELQQNIISVRAIDNELMRGFGRAITYGLDKMNGECVSFFMADLSDDPYDLVKFYKKLQEGYDCIFGSRFVKGGSVEEYPLLKLILNRIVNNFIKIAFQINYNDITNAFKLYRKEVIENTKPILSYHYNLTVELPLKSIIRGHSYCILPNSWKNRKYGVSKLKIKEMGSRYLFIILYCLLEKWLSRGDYKRRDVKESVVVSS